MTWERMVSLSRRLLALGWRYFGEVACAELGVAVVGHSCSCSCSTGSLERMARWRLVA